jgi:hypothetical protein
MCPPHSVIVSLPLSGLISIVVNPPAVTTTILLATVLWLCISVCVCVGLFPSLPLFFVCCLWVLGGSLLSLLFLSHAVRSSEQC